METICVLKKTTPKIVVSLSGQYWNDFTSCEIDDDELEQGADSPRVRIEAWLWSLVCDNYNDTFFEAITCRFLLIRGFRYWKEAKWEKTLSHTTDTDSIGGKLYWSKTTSSADKVRQRHTAN